MSNYSENDWRNYSELYHHGIQGQKWGVRRYQNSDGSLTPAGKKRYDGSNRNPLDVYDSRSKAAKAVGGTLGGVVGLAGAAAFTLTTGFIAPYLQLGLVAAAAGGGASLAQKIVDKHTDIRMSDVEKWASEGR